MKGATSVSSRMRPLTEEETKIFFEKLMKYVGANIKFLVERKDEDYCFRLHRNRVYYMPERLAKRASNVKTKKLVAVGTCFGKFTKTLKFKLHITSIDYLAQYARYKVWIKPSSEMSYLYGNNIVKSGLGRITENTPKHQGVVLLNMADVPIGFGVTAKSTLECRKAVPTDVVCFHQADLGEYLRDEATLM